jgi:hypothetical protein
LVHANAFFVLLASLMLIAFVSLIAAGAAASKAHEHTPNAWTWLALAAAAQIVSVMILASLVNGLNLDDRLRSAGMIEISHGGDDNSTTASFQNPTVVWPGSARDGRGQGSRNDGTQTAEVMMKSA